MKPLKAQNYYDLLGVARQASPEEIRSAYEISRHTFQENSLATYSLFSDQENQEILALIAKAFETLFNPESRRVYDQQLRQQEGDPPPAPPGARPVSSPRGNGASAAAPLHGVPPPPQGAGTRVRPAEAEGAHRMTPPLAERESSRPEAARPAAAGQPTVHSAAQPAASASAARSVPMPLFRMSTPPAAPAAAPAAAAKLAPVVLAPASTAARDELLKTVVRFDGSMLKRMRQILGISLEDLAERSKIRRAYLEYIEEENFQFLPAAVYVKGFVTLMATILGLPPQRVADDYMQIFRAKNP
jgi:hypothetical protein